MTVTMNGHAPIGAEVLSREELLALDECERIIERGLTTFVEVGNALTRVREHKLYRGSYATFEAYCAAKWSISRPRAYELIAAAEVVSGIPDTLPAPANAGQASALAKVPEDQRAEVWAEVNETEGKVTAEKIRDAADKRKPDLAPTILDALADAGREGLDFKAIASAYPEPPAEKDLTRALEKLTKSGEIVVTRTWGGNKPRKWASAEAYANLTPEVLSTLAGYGARGTTAFQVAFRIEQPVTEALENRVMEVLREQLTAGEVSIVGESEGNTVWALTSLLTTETPEPVAAPSTAPIGPGLAGSDSAPPEPEPATKRSSADPTSKPTGNADLEDRLAAESAHRAVVRNLTSVLTYLNPVAISPVELAEREYAAVLDEFSQEELDRAAETMATIAALKRGAR